MIDENKINEKLQSVVYDIEKQNNIKIIGIESYNGDIIDKKGNETEGLKFLVMFKQKK